MKVRFTKKEGEMLVEVVRRFNWQSNLIFEEYETCVVLDGLDEDEVIDLRELCSDYLSEIGFDKDYEPNAKGRLLETLVDKLFVK